MKKNPSRWNIRVFDVICTHFDGHFDGHRNAGVLYRMHSPMEEVCGFHKSL